MKESSLHFIDQNRCDAGLASRYLCQIPQPDPPLTPELTPVSLPEVTRDFRGVSLTLCPLSHWTHEFLACDTKSACWAEEHGASYTCGVYLTPLPPMMTCSNGVQRVPYTLVCDHRSDCGDGSDEDFCVFPQCQLSGYFDCANQEVG